MEPLEFIDLACGASSARVSTHGAHVVSYVRDGAPVLFLSERALFQRDKAIRGGVPLIFPQFSSRGPLPSHGFARTALWTVVQRGADSVTLELKDSAATRALWPAAFVVHYTVRVTPTELSLTLSVTAQADALSFTTALHTYLAVGDVASARVEGLFGVRFQDHLAEMAER